MDATTDNLSFADVTRASPPEQKVALFRSLFHGRDDVFARRFESARTGRSGYQPVCLNEWRRGVCDKKSVACARCPNRQFVPLSDETVTRHPDFLGPDPPGLVVGQVHGNECSAKLAGVDLSTFPCDLEPGQFACAETVTIKGPKGVFENVRILGPERKETQCEILASDQFKLGVPGCPVRESGQLEGSAGFEIVERLGWPAAEGFALGNAGAATDREHCQ